MKTRYLLGFDVGTSESKGTLCDFAGNIVAKASSKHSLKSPHPGWAEHDPIGDWWCDFKKIVRELLDISGAQPEEIAAIGISAIMAAITPVDEDFNPLRNAILYGIDTRCMEQIEKLNNSVPREKLLEFGGPCTVDSYGPKILWIREKEPEVYAKTKMFTLCAGFMVGKLTGVNVVDPYSVKSSVPMINQKTLEWDDEMCALVCPKEMMPAIPQTTSSVVGYVTEKAAREVGLAPGTPVTCGTTDAGAEAVSVGVSEAGDVMLMYGSTAFYDALTDRPLPTAEHLWCDEYVLPGLYCYNGGMATTGSLTRWLLDNFASEYLEQEKRGEVNAYDAMFAEAENIPLGSDGLICLPYFMGERMPIQDPKAKGTFFGLNLRHTRGHLVRAALEGIAYGIGQNFDQLREAGIPITTVTAVGGGTKTPLWLQIVSDVCNVRQIVPEVTVGASYGDAMLAGIGIGVLKPEDIKKIVKIKYIVEPDPARHKAYKKYRELYRELYERTKDIMHKL